MIVTAPRGNAEVEPTALKFAGLGGGTVVLSDIVWSSWGGEHPTGTATSQFFKNGDSEDELTVRVVLGGLNSQCGPPLYRKVTLFYEKEGQYFPIECPMIRYTEVDGARRAAALLKKDFGVSGRCMATGQEGFYECRADLPRVGHMRLGVAVSKSGESATITRCEPTARLKPNEVADCVLRRIRG